MKLGDFARGQGVRLLNLEDVDSTNEEARRLIAAGERGPLWIVAARQTKGRGRLGRDWISDRKSTRLNSSHTDISRMPSSA